jgi:hypothetical protein
MTHRYGIAATLFALLLLFAAVPAHAQAFAVFISGNGSDANNCLTPDTACRSLGAAQTAVSSGGIIHVLPGDYSSVGIVKSVQIIADQGQASISGSTSGAGGIFAGIMVNAGPSDVVLVRGMTVDRHGSGAGGGIGLVAGGALHIENCTLVNAGAQFGIHFRPSGNSELVVSNSTIANNAGGGIEVRPGASASATVTIDNARLLNNNRGIAVFNRGSVTMRNSTIAGNTMGVRAAGGNASARIANSTITGNQTGLNAVSGSQIVSHRGNVLTDNVNDGAFTGAVNQQ